MIALSLSILFCLSFTFSIFLTMSPLALGLWTLLLAFIFSFAIMLFSSSWFAMSTLLIYVGGMMVMFSYFVALTPNHQINISPMFIASPFILFVTAPLLALVPPSTLQSSSSPPPITTMFNMFNIPTLLLLVMTLFLALVAVVKITSKFSGPLRPFYNS